MSESVSVLSKYELYLREFSAHRVEDLLLTFCLYTFSKKQQVWEFIKLNLYSLPVVKRAQPLWFLLLTDNQAKIHAVQCKVFAEAELLKVAVG